MEHRIVELAGFDAVGYETECPGGDNSSIGLLWDRYFEGWQPLPGSTGIIGVSWCDGGDSGFSYMAAHRLAEGAGEQAAQAAQPAGGPYATRSFPAGRYLGVPFHARVEEMKTVFQDLMQRVIPELGLTMAPQGACIEDYPADCWDPATQTIRCELLVQVS